MSITVSIVEDDPQLLDCWTQLINSSPGYRCASSHGNAHDALEVIPGLEPDVTLVGLDRSGINGVECARRLKLQLPTTEIIMFATFQNMEHIFSALAAGATGYMLKCTPSKELLAAIKEVHSGGLAMSSYVARKIVESFHQSAPVSAILPGLSPRETEVLDLLAKGFRYKEIAAKLDISYATVHTHIKHIYEKLHVRSRTEAVMKYSARPKQLGSFSRVVS